MDSNNPEFIKCAMDAIEEGVKADEIKEECACRMGIKLLKSSDENINQQS